MKRLSGMTIVLSLLVGSGCILVWAGQVNDRISRCLDDYDPAYLADMALRTGVCMDETP